MLTGSVTHTRGVNIPGERSGYFWGGTGNVWGSGRGTFGKPLDCSWNLQSAVKQRGRERKGPPEIIQKFCLRFPYDSYGRGRAAFWPFLGEGFWGNIRRPLVLPAPFFYLEREHGGQGRPRQDHLSVHGWEKLQKLQSLTAKGVACNTLSLSSNQRTSH